MRILRNLLTVLSALSIVSALSPAAMQSPISIPREQVNVEVGGTVSTGSCIKLDLRSFWETRDDVTGREVLSFWVALPDRGEPHVEVRTLSPMEQLPELQGCVELGRPAILRGIRIAPLIVRPSVQNGERWDKIVSLTLQIRTSGSGANEVLQNRRSRSFDYIINSFVINPPKSSGIDEFDQEHLLVICPDFAEDVMTPFVEWKRRKGLEVTLSTLDSIGIAADDYVGLKVYIQEAYDTWINPPDFVLLAGDETVLPVRWDYTNDPVTIYSYGSVPGHYVDENYFACLEGNDFFPDILLGRWPIPISEGEYPYVYLSAKIMRYEMDPNLYNTEWYQHSVVTAQDENYPYQPEPSQRTTKLYTRDIMLNYGFAEVDTLFGVGTSSILVQWISDGRSYINYRGAGWADGWAGVSFGIEHVLQLQNSFMLPVVTGIGCGGGLFGEPDACFGEFWMWIIGTITNHRGAIAFIGPGWNTHTMFNDSLDIGIYQSIFEDFEPRIAASLVAGKMFMYDAFDDSILIDPGIEEILRVAFNQYYVFSDPELMQYNDIPAQLQTTIPGALTTGSFPLTFTITDSGGQPFEGAQVCLYHPTDFQSADITGPDGTVTLDWNVSTESSFTYFTATAHNHAAIVDSISVIGNNPYILHYDYELDDSIGGNADGGLSPGETAIWTEYLRNWGLVGAMDVTATLSSAEPTATIFQDYATFGDMPAESIAVGSPNYEISLDAEQYEVGSLLEFLIDITDAADSSWTSSISIPLITPMLTVVYAGPNIWLEQYQVNRGDTAGLQVFVYNSGLADIFDGTLELISYDPYVEILESVIPLDSLLQGSSYFTLLDTIGGADSFLVTTVLNIPIDHEAEFFLKLTSEQSTYTYADSVAFSLVFQGFFPGDPTYDSTGTYYAYESFDTLYPKCPVYEWFEIDPIVGGPGEVLPFSAQTQTLTVDLPFTFKYWGEDFTRFTISADGWIMPGETDAVLPMNVQLPAGDDVSGIIAALWDDLWYTAGETGRISIYHDSESGKFYIEYYDITHGTTTMPHETFQIVLCDPTIYPTVSGDGEILFYYHSLHLFGIVSSTVGLESIDQASAVQYSFINGYPQSAHGLQDSLAILWTPDPPFELSVPQPPEPVRWMPIPMDFSFSQPYPNPFNPVTQLSFALPASGKVVLDVFNLQGQRVAILYDGNLNAGWHRFEFDSSNLGSGMYFARLFYKNQVTVRKLILIK